MTGSPSFLSAIIGPKAAEALGRRRMALLLAALILLILASPVADVARGTRLIIVVANVGFLGCCLQQVASYPRLRLAARSLVLFWLLLNLPLSQLSRRWVAGADATTLAALNACVLWLVAQQVIRAKRVDAELLCSAFGAYLLIGVFWAETYEIIRLIEPAAFSVPNGAALNRSTVFYFSFTTLTTTGYGDVTAVNPIVRMWAILEAVIGTMYTATVIARLVSLYGSASSE